MLRFYNIGGGDTGLVINDASGRWHCDDDSHSGLDPEVNIHGAPSGQYDVWVTSYQSGPRAQRKAANKRVVEPRQEAYSARQRPGAAVWTDC
jgi:hypothetical protein